MFNWSLQRKLEWGRKNTLKNNDIYFLNVEKIINTQIQNSQQTPSRRNKKKLSVRHITIKFFKTHDKEILLISPEKQR